MKKEISFSLDFDKDVDEYLQKKYKTTNYQILSRSLDARKAPLGRVPQYVFRVLFGNDEKQDFLPNIKLSLNQPPVIIGSGPAGLFAALRLKDYGIKSIVLERGEAVQERMLSISKYWRYGKLNTESNVCFGEGGAGLFSDGKLYTRVKSPFIKYVLEKFVSYGADEKILYIANPHLGSHKIRKIIKKMTQELIDFGSEVRFNSKVEDLLIENDRVLGVKLSNEEKIHTQHVILAAGHSARHFYEKIYKKNVSMKKKDFAVGVRIEHQKKYLDQIQFGKFAKDLGAATYKISYHDHEKNVGTYSFCMCPGGYVLSSGTEEGKIVTNGMSNDSHNSPWSNAGIVVSVKSENLSEGMFSGFDFIEDIEKKAYEEAIRKGSGRELPAVTLGEFLNDSLDESKELPKTSVPSKLVKSNFRNIFPEFIIKQLQIAFEEFNKKLSGFSHHDALLIAPETRTSSPITISRDKSSFESISTKGLYPCGEGAGYAGGITSAAVDGIKLVESLVKSL